ncbi:hypothetical protein FACS189467_8780 [Bacteroidia bacterium]|nr:hypothetical protein FACS189467_8780 [Bacteroidia bacterium]
MKTKWIILAVVLLGNMLSARAQDDLYYNPKSRSAREIDIKKNPDERYVAPPVPSSTPPPHRDVWGDGNVDSVGEDDALIYEITDDRQAYNDDRRGDEEFSYEQRLRFDDPTYVVVYRDPYWDYPYYGAWGGYYRNGWGWGLGWGLWGGYYGWNYPYYHYPYYHLHYHQCLKNRQ